jgi:hypothetical protein
LDVISPTKPTVLAAIKHMGNSPDLSMKTSHSGGSLCVPPVNFKKKTINFVINYLSKINSHSAPVLCHSHVGFPTRFHFSHRNFRYLQATNNMTREIKKYD